MSIELLQPFEIDALVDADPLKLRDYAHDVSRSVLRQAELLAEADDRAEAANNLHANAERLLTEARAALSEVEADRQSLQHRLAEATQRAERAEVVVHAAQTWASYWNDREGGAEAPADVEIALKDVTAAFRCQLRGCDGKHGEVGTTPAHDDKDDPESYCHRCKGPNVSWSAPSPLWNEVMRGGDINGPWQYGEIICPTCFAVIAEELGIANYWQFNAPCTTRELKTVTPSGRVWDADCWLWVEPPAQLDPAHEAVMAAKLDADLADINRRAAADRWVLGAAEAMRDALADVDAGGLLSIDRDLIAAVDARRALADPEIANTQLVPQAEPITCEETVAQKTPRGWEGFDV